MQIITVSELCNKFKISGAVARKVCRDLAEKNVIKQVGDHHSTFTLYTGAQAKAASEVPEKPSKK